MKRRSNQTTTMKRSTKRSRPEIVPENPAAASMDLPEELIHHILSFLPEEKDAIHSSLLSKAWFHAWSTKPRLKFDLESRFQTSSIEEEEEGSHDQLADAYPQSVGSVDSTLRRYYYSGLPIESFDLAIKILDRDTAYRLFAWLWIVSRCGLKHLKQLSLSVTPNDVSCKLPSEIFECENLHTMKISVCDVETPVCFLCDHDEPVVKCYSLKVLELERVRISEKLMGELFSKCPLMEKIILHSCKGFEEIKARGLRHLQELEIISMDGEIVEIDAPGLRSFVFATRYDDDFGEHFGINIDSSKSLTSLALHGVHIKDEELNKIISKFPLLEQLTIDENSLVESIGIRSDSLRELSVSRCVDLDHIEVQAPRLHVLRFRGNSLPWFSFPNVDPDKLKAELTLSFMDEDILCNSFFNCLKQALMGSRNAELRVEIHGSAMLYVDQEELQTESLPANYSLKDLFIDIESCEYFTSFSALENAFISVCHPRSVQTCCRYHMELENQDMQVICKLKR